MASTSLSFTPSSTGNRKTWTLSYWVKFSDTNQARAQRWFSAGNSGTGNLLKQEFYSGGGTRQIALIDNNASSINGGSGVRLVSGRYFNDPTAWYHIVYAVDTTQSTASDRVKMYVNGEQMTDFDVFSEYPGLNYDFNANVSGQALQLGRSYGFGSSTPNYFDGRMAHVHWIDGTAYDASYFGQTDSTTGEWKPIVAPSVTYGTNGFFLKFESSGSMGTDSSGNGNNHTVNGSLTQTQDTPSNNFATLDPSSYTTYTYSNANTQITRAGGTAQSTSVCTHAVNKGKWYWEVKMVSGQSNYPRIGIYRRNSDKHIYETYLGNASSDGATGVWWGSRADNANHYLGNGTSVITSSYAEYNNGDILMFALDMDNTSIWFGVNGTWYTSSTTTTTSAAIANNTGTAAVNNLTSGAWYSPAIFGNAGSDVWAANFGEGYFGTTAVSSSNADDAGFGLFEYAPPSGFYSLCTKNINTYG